MSLRSSLRAVVESIVVGRRHSRSAQTLRRVAQLVNDVYENVGSDFDVNGERGLIERLAPARFGVAFDVGANVGHWTEVAVSKWPGVRVHAFEVAPATFQKLQDTIERSGASDRVVANMAGLGERDGSQDMYFYRDRPDITCDRPRHDGPVQRFTATITSGDRYLETAGVTQVDFLKIDVEGMESAVLAGFQRALAAGAIRCVQFEYGAFSLDTRVLLKDFFQLLGPAYVIGKVLQRGVDFRDYDWTMEDFRFANFLAVQRHEAAIVELARGAQ